MKNFGNKWLMAFLGAMCLLCCTIHFAEAQSSKKSPAAFNQANNRNNTFLNKQWWLGVKGGTTLTDANVEKQFTVIEPTNYSADATGKKYTRFKEPGSMVSFEVSFFWSGFLLSFQPAYQNSRFTYTNSYRWHDDGETNNIVELNYDQQQQLAHVILPLVVKYAFNISRVIPYVQAGVYSAHLLNANKAVTVSGIDYASGGENNFTNETLTIGADDLYAKNHWGMMAGVGAYYNLGNVRLSLDVVYRMGMSNIVSEKNRYSSDRLSGVGDAMDDLTMNSVVISVGTLFPLRFLSSGFKSVN
jgi:hypothetical protein